MKRLGIDIGSTTIKCVVLNEKNETIFNKYERHKALINQKLSELLNEVHNKFNENMLLSISGSAGIGISNDLDIPFVQEVYATRIAAKKFNPNIDAIIELGGEDAKILFLKDIVEVRMNGTCAGGTGAFIDQMAELLNVSSNNMNTLAYDSHKKYTIASRCGVFAKSDIQPLLNQGVSKEDISSSIFYAIVNQTIAGLAHGRNIEGNVLYLGGPLTFFPYLRDAFDDVLKIKGICPENSLYFVAMGSAISPTSKEYNLKELSEKCINYKSSETYLGCNPLFKNKKEYNEFIKRHKIDSIKTLTKPKKKMYLGIDAGSTTIKALLIDDEGNIFNPLYLSNKGNPTDIIKDYLKELYDKHNDIEIICSAVTGYGESLIKNAFGIDYGIVETMAHYEAAKKFCKNVDFILDIGGQDIKCFKIKNNSIDSIFLNEACSSGCGSFLQTYAGVLGYKTEEFAKLALFADNPVDLGSRCTVFMNSSIKQAQKDGATIENISAGLAISVVKNALYKVIRCINPKLLGDNIVVQGGTFLNDAVLRAFEQEIGKNVLRPNISGLMGAYGAALYAKSKHNKKSTIITKEELKEFSYTVQQINCNGCSNHCKLNVNKFTNGNRFIAGNRCEKPLKLSQNKKHYDLYEYKYNLLNEYQDKELDKNKKTIGIPRVLNMYELLPFWYKLFKELDFNVILSDESSYSLYLQGQNTIPSDTICYPAKIAHGHIEDLIKKEPDIIFYPSMSYNFDEGLGRNHYNCPVVAYYPRVIESNMNFKNITFISGFIGLYDKKEFSKHFIKLMNNFGIKLNKKDVDNASKKAYKEYENFMKATNEKAQEFIEIAKQENVPIIVLAGRPYHIDKEINHGINKLICDLGAIVITEESISSNVNAFDTTVLNQWTYHSRLYAAAKYVCDHKELNINLVQLVSFGCGVDAVTQDEVRTILESHGKLYTQLKIDEISNLGSIKIRLRSLFAFIEEERMNSKD